MKKQPKDLGGHPTPQQAEEALRDSEERFRTMANAIPQFAGSPEVMAISFGTINAGTHYTGTTPEEMEGWGWQRVHDPEALPRCLNSGNPPLPPASLSIWYFRCAGLMASSVNS